jgi:DNA polymerase III epsilon subunit-like protein
MRILVFDTETTGLIPKNKQLPRDIQEYPYIVQFSFMLYNIETFTIEKLSDYIVRLPEHIEIPEESSKIHGITTRMTKVRGIPINEVFDDFENTIQQANVIVGHNLSFDIEMYRKECILNHRECKINKELFNTKSQYCTMKHSCNLCRIERVNSYGMYYKYPTLLELHQFLFKETPSNLHNSMVDVLSCLRCYYKLVYDRDLLMMDTTFKKIYPMTLKTPSEIKENTE